MEGVPPVFRAWFDSPLAAAYLLPGEGAGLAGLIAELLPDRMRGEGQTAELVLWTAADLERESPEAVWRTPSFFCRYRVFLMPDLGELKKAIRDGILAYLAAPDPNVALVLPCSDRSVTRAFSAVPAVRTAALREDQAVSALAAYAVAAAHRSGKRMPREAADFLVRWVGTDFSRVKAECAKLVSFAGDREEIREDEVRQVCIAAGGVDPFAIAEKLVRGDARGCVSLFRRFSAGAESSEYHALVGAIAWFVRKRLADKASPLSPRKGGKILAALSSIDRGMKGESGLSPEQVFEIHLLKLLA